MAAESLGLGVCYIGAVRNDPQVVADLLALPDAVYPVFGMCLGYPDQAPEPKPRLPLSMILQEDRYQDPEALIRDGIRDYDARIREYYRTRAGGGKDSCWSEEMKAVVGKESRPHMRGFLARRGFTLG